MLLIHSEIRNGFKTDLFVQANFILVSFIMLSLQN